jgi:hypothetical protein
MKDASPQSPAPGPSLARAARATGLGRLAYHLWHRPAGSIRDCLREGGPFERRRTERGRAEMEAAAAALPALAPFPGEAIRPHVLTGRRFWYQTAFCLWTLARQSQRTVAPVIYDDGTLEEPGRAQLRAAFPAASFVDKPAARARLEERLPAGRYPTLRERWENYPHIRKIIDPHLGSTGWKLVMDSDLLFFRRPDALIGHLERADRPLHAVDCATSYGYSPGLMAELAGRPVAGLVNVGLTGLESGGIDWDRLEAWCRVLVEREGRSYYLEQALVALLLAGRDCAVLPAGDYVTLPRPPEARACRAVMHHYVAESKRWYFQHNWRRALAPR